MLKNRLRHTADFVTKLTLNWERVVILKTCQVVSSFFRVKIPKFN